MQKIGIRLAIMLVPNAGSFGQNYNWQQHIPVDTHTIISSTNSSNDKGHSNVDVGSIVHYGTYNVDSAQDISKSIIVYGVMNSRNTNFAKDVTILGNGTIKGNENYISGKLSVKGSLEISGVVCYSNVEVYGYVNAEKIVSKNDFLAYTSKINFKDSELGNLIVDDKEDRPAVINIENCKIKGKIEVKSGKGTVSIHNSDLSNVSITGASVVKN